MLFTKNRGQAPDVHWSADSALLSQVIIPARTAPTGPHQCLLGPSVTIVGDLATEGDVQIDGRITGTIKCAQLVVGSDAAVNGAITAQEVIARGKITGMIRATRVVMQSTAKVESEIVYTLLSIEEGARFEGAARRKQDALHDEPKVSATVELRQLVAVRGPRNGAAAQSNNEAASAAPM